MRRMRKSLAVLAVSGALVAGLAGTAEAHISLVGFSIWPSCVAPGEVVNYRVDINQSHWYHVHTLYVYVEVAQAQTGLVIYRSPDYGPYSIPVGNWTTGDKQSDPLPLWTPSGDYNIVLHLGSSRGGSEWATAARGIRVRPTMLLCAV